MRIDCGLLLLALTLTSASACRGPGSTPSDPSPPAPSPPSPTSSAVTLLDDFGGRALFPADNWWNQDISQAPVDARSAALIDYIGRSIQLHPDFGPPPYGMPYVGVGSTQPRVAVNFVEYGNESDAGVRGDNGYPLPDQAKSDSGYIEGNVAGGGNSGDRHLLVVDRDRWLLFELYHARWTGQRWDAGSGAIFDLASNGRRPEGWTSADAAGLTILPGLVRYDEASAAREITHAFRVTVRATNGYVWPASHNAGSTGAAPPMGARLRLKPGKDFSRHPAYIQRMFRAMQRYGLIVADNGTDMYITGTMDRRWNNDELNPAFASLTSADFDVVQLGWR